MPLKLRRRPDSEPGRRPSRPTSDGPSSSEAQGAGPTPEGEAIGRFIDHLIAEERYAFALLRSAEGHVTEAEAAPARAILDGRMALIPPGRIAIERDDGDEEAVEVPAFYLDRLAVTNRQFARFVAAGGYDSLELWPREVWSSLPRFTDRSGHPGPSVWSGGTYPKGKADHPVVGLCWHEAAAYARWVGKRPPRASERRKAGGWPEHLGGGGTRYPWGDLFDPSRANLGSSGPAETVPVDAFAQGDTPNGIRQMTGNVWEWLEDPLTAIPCQGGESFLPWKPMRRIVGGAFDTYLPGEATCHFITGQGELDRHANIGFRLALSADRLREPPSPS